MNNEELLGEWQRTCQRVLEYDNVDPTQARAFLARLKPQAMSDGFIMLTADNGWLRDWITGHYSDAIARALADIHGGPYTVAIEVDENQQVNAAQHAEGQSAGAAGGAHQAEPQAAATGARDMTHPAPSVEESQAELSTIADNSPAGQALSHGNPYNDDRLARRSEPAAGDSLPISPATGTDEQLTQGLEASPTGARDASQPLDEGLVMPTSSLTFENFVIGASNQMAYSMAVAVAEDPGQQMLNPLFIYGKSGLGKTHLMRAIQNYVAETRPQLSTVYVDSADFLQGYVDATMAHQKEKSSFKNFKSRYQDADILLIDDIQYLQGREQTLDIVFQIFNHMVDEGKQVVLSADRAPKNITMDERYQSRFNKGGTFDIQPPEVETKLGIIKSFVEEYRATSGHGAFSFSEDIARYIAENSSSNIRELKSAVTKVIYAMNVFKKESITEEEVAQLLENHFSGGAMKKLTIADIQKQVELYYDVPHSDLTGQKRSRKIVYARQVAIYLVREMLDLPYNYIGKSFGGRDHTTIMYSVANVEKKLKDTREVREEIENIKRRIKEM